MRTPAAALAALALVCGCKQPQAQLKLLFPPDPDGGALCQDQTNLRCVNYVQFTAGGDETSSRCTRLEITLDNLCDLGRIAEGQEVFRLARETPLPIRIEGLRVYPATGCTSTAECPPKKVFSGMTTGEVGETIGDFAGRVLELPVTVHQPCGDPEEFYPLPDGGTCVDVCHHSPDLVVCDHVLDGCLCKKLPDKLVFQDAGPEAGMDGGQGGIDASP